MKNKLEKQRNIINKIDKRILNLLEKRFITVKNIADYKKKNGLNIFQPDREKEIIKKLIKETQILNNEFVEKLYRLIFRESKKIQNDK